MGEKIIKVSFGTARFFNNIIELTINEGENVKLKDIDTLFELFDTYFPDTKFGYISNRINDYSIDLSPGLYKSFHENLVANAVVCYSEASFKNAKFEKEFYKQKPLEVFRDYDEALKWLKRQL